MPCTDPKRREKREPQIYTYVYISVFFVGSLLAVTRRVACGRQKFEKSTRGMTSRLILVIHSSCRGANIIDDIMIYDTTAPPHLTTERDEVSVWINEKWPTSQ
jgi:hypothetical protein